MRSCLNCGGAIFPSGIPIYYVGDVCQCADGYPPVTGFPEIKKPTKLSDFIEEATRSAAEKDRRNVAGKITELPSGTDLSKIAPGPVIKVDSGPPVTPAAFIYWLRGYFAAGGPHVQTQGDWKRIAEELAKVHL